MEKFEFKRNLVSSNTINIHLVKSMGLTGISDDTNDFVESTKISLVNPTTDAEYIRLVYFGNNFDLIPNFKGADQTYNNSLTNALFNNIEIKNRVDVITNSYFIFELYDLNDISNQTLLSSNKMDIYTRSGYTYNMFDNNDNILVKIPYIYPNKYFLEFSNIYIPNNYIDDLKNDIVYLKIRFFNSKLGGVTDFYIGNATLEPNETDFFIKLIVDKNNYRYGFDNNDNNILNIYENKNVNLTKLNNIINPQNPILNDSKKDNIIIGYGESGN